MTAASLPWILVSPASRGIGHALTRRLLATTTLPILATTRSHDTEGARAALLEGLGLDDGGGGGGNDGTQQQRRRLQVVRCDVGDEASMTAAAREAARRFPPDTHHLHLACVMPGVLRVEKTLEEIDAEAALELFRVNAVGPMLMAKHFWAFLPRRRTVVDESCLSMSSFSSSSSSSTSSSWSTTPPDDDKSGSTALARHATWLTMAARVGSTADNGSGGWFSYRASKAAVINFTRGLDLTVARRSGDAALAVAYHPGTVRTDFTRDFWHSRDPARLFSPDYAVARLVDVVARLRRHQRGRCWDWKGDEVPP